MFACANGSTILHTEDFPNPPMRSNTHKIRRIGNQHIYSWIFANLCDIINWKI